VSSVDWAQSSLNNVSPLITREFEQDSNATIVAVADASMSTRCGVNGVPIAAAIARSVAAVGLSAVFFQDQFGLITFDDHFRQMAAARPRIGKPHVIYCLDLYQQFKTTDATGGPGGKAAQDVTATIEGHLRKTSMVPVISDFLLPDVEHMMGELSNISGMHDVFLMMADVRFAFQLPSASAGWIETLDVETGGTRVVSRREFARMGERIEQWQAHVMNLARDNDLDIVRVGLDRWEMETTLIEFARERRLRKFQ